MHHESISETLFSHACAEILDFEPVIPMSDDESAAFDSARAFLTEFERNGVWAKVAFHRVILQVMSYSLLDYDKVNKAYSIHPLVHEWLRVTLDHPYAYTTRLCVQSILSLAVSNDHSTVGLTHNRLLLPHIDNAVEGLYHELGSEVASHIRRVYSDAGRWMETEQLDRTVLETRKRVLGEEHYSTLTSMSNLASTYSNLGRWTEAERLQVKGMEISKRILGEEHPSTLTSMSNLALTYSDLGRWTEAERLQVTVMEARTRVLGKDHPDTLISMQHLALIYKEQSRSTEAEELDVKVLGKRTRMPEEDPDTPMSMEDPALTQCDQGRAGGQKRRDSRNL